MIADTDSRLRETLAALLRDGIQTEWRRRAYSHQEIGSAVAHLQQIPADDYEGKLKAAGFTPHPYLPPEDADLEQSCATCMYFERHRRFCSLPELGLPVLPEWSCRLWRI